MSEKKNNPGPYMTRDECAKIVGSMEYEISTIKKALIGEDFRGGLVKDVADIKMQLAADLGTTTWVRNVVVSIGVSVISATVTAAIIGVM